MSDRNIYGSVDDAQELNTALNSTPFHADEAAAATAAASVEIQGRCPHGCGICPCACCRKNRLEIIVLLALLTAGGVLLLTGAGVLFSHTLTNDFQFHQSCVVCLKHHRGVFNQTNGTCVAMNSTSRNTSDDTSSAIVFSSAFCGAPDCQEKVLLTDLRLTPYWVSFVSSVFGVVLSALINVLKLLVLRPIKKRCYSFEDDLDQLETEIVDPNQVIAATEGENDEKKQLLLSVAKETWLLLQIVGAMDPYFFLLLYCFAIAHLVFIIWHTCSITSSSSSSSPSGWIQFQAIFSTWLSSGTSLIVAMLYSQLATVGAAGVLLSKRIGSDNIPRTLRRTLQAIYIPIAALPFVSHEKTQWWLIVFMLPMFPAFVCLILPALIIFAPLTAALFALWAVLYTLLRQERWFSDSVASVNLFVARVLGSFLCLIFFQASVSYAVLFFSGEHTWAGVIRRDFELRSTRCWANAFANGVQSANLNLAGLLLS